MSGQIDISKQLEETLKDYGGILKKCTEAMETNSKDNKAKIGEISLLVKEIKEKIMGANDNLKLINENRERFDKATKEKQSQLEEAVRRSQEENTKKMAELQNQQSQAKEAADKRIQEIELNSKNELDKALEELNNKHKQELEGKMEALTVSEESRAALEEKQKEAQLQIERINEENRKQKEANESDMLTKKNELERVKQSLLQKQEELKGIMTQTADKDKKIEELNNLITKLQEDLKIQIQKDEAEIDKLGKEKENIIEEKLRDLKKTNQEHDAALIELNNKHEEAIKEIKLKMLEEFEQQKKDAVEEALKVERRASEEKVSASNGEKQIIEQQVKQCNEDKKRFSDQLLEAQKTIEGLKRDYNNQEEASLNKLETEVRELGGDVDQLQEKLNLDKLLKEADDTIAQSKEIAGTDPSKKVDVPNEPVPKLESDDTDLPEGWKEATDPNSGQKYYYNKKIGATQWEKPTMGNLKVDETRESEVSGDLHPLEIDKTAKENALRKFRLIKNAIKAKRAFNDQDKMDFKNMLLSKGDNEGVIEAYTRRITHRELDELIERIVDSNLHGMGLFISGKFKTKIEKIINDKSTTHHKQHHILMKRMLESMIKNNSTYYQDIANEIDKHDKHGFEKTFEQLLTAFHLAWGVKGIADLYRFGHDSTHGHPYENEDLQKVGKVAMKLWATPFEKYEDVKLMKEARNHITKDRTGIYAYYHKHDDEEKKKNKKSDVAFAGGFRHGKRSKKQNRRSLKSKLMAKKFSLKSKKKGKNKSKKRRKSIKIRIN